MKYATVAELVAAYKSGELGPDNELGLDNDTTSVYTHDVDWMPAGTERVFEMHPADLIEQCLTLLGIPWSRV